MLTSNLMRVGTFAMWNEVRLFESLKTEIISSDQINPDVAAEETAEEVAFCSTRKRDSREFIASSNERNELELEKVDQAIPICIIRNCKGLLKEDTRHQFTMVFLTENLLPWMDSQSAVTGESSHIMVSEANT
ncbi:hypothetical protein BTVI_41747 [Pitangus sulphuratus]|nr:hypothetical protein BTVI_41747 [Pitangus sulphuratus]